ncbi:MAG TPA: sensor domain-containing diguanylate cyclase [Beijerinckiaceae bacterium]|jgi:diguanylate cyclase (GGDEF)-like protein|nr:sensor domain-containing diguanylate cyclase [Beijerinckiaceae bacterium]
MERLSRFRKTALLIGAVLLLFASFVGLIGLILVQERSDAIDRAKLHLGNLRSTAESSLDSIIHSFELSLDAVVFGLEKFDVTSYPPAVQRAILFDRSVFAPQFSGINIIDATGRVIMNSRDETLGLREGDIATTTLHDRSFFDVHAKRDDVGLYVSEPFKRRQTGEWVIVFSRRFAAADGGFGGVVAGALRVSYLQALLDRLDLGRRGSASLVRTDGTLLVRSPSTSDPTMGLPVKDLLQVVDRETRGVFEAKSNAEERLYAYARLEKLPIVLSISESKAEILADWKWRAMIIVLAMILLLTLAAILLLRFSSELDRRREAELALQKAARQLEHLSLTDSLTGLANRRSFDIAFEREWARHHRERAPLSLLLIDIDHFKAYNDHYGHPAGDGTLSLVARIIETEARRQIDVAARYGGEEFALILPDTDADGALAVAERIRVTLAQQEILHSHGINGMLTMSIGVATAGRADTDWDARKLLEAADHSLYEAKHAGRNCIAARQSHGVTAIAVV